MRSQSEIMGNDVFPKASPSVASGGEWRRGGVFTTQTEGQGMMMSLKGIETQSQGFLFKEGWISLFILNLYLFFL